MTTINKETVLRVLVEASGVTDLSEHDIVADVIISPYDEFFVQASIEVEFGVQLNDGFADEYTTIGDLIDFIIMEA